MSRALTAKQYRIAAAVCADDRAPLSQSQIAEIAGFNQNDFSTTLKKAAMKMGLVSAAETSHVSRIRLVVASRKAGGFDQLAASMGLLNRDLETVQ